MERCRWAISRFAMKIFGKTLSEYVRFERTYLVVILVVGLIRLTASLIGLPNSTAKFFSLTVLFLAGMIYYGVRVHTSGFGSYPQLLPVLALPVILGNLVIIAGISIAILTHRDNIFSAPEFSPGKVDGKTWAHAASHAVVMLILPIMLWVVGSLVMFVSKKLTPNQGQPT
jgi:hypothetical protein